MITDHASIEMNIEIPVGINDIFYGDALDDNNYNNDTNDGKDDNDTKGSSDNDNTNNDNYNNNNNADNNNKNNYYYYRNHYDACMRFVSDVCLRQQPVLPVESLDDADKDHNERQEDYIQRSARLGL